jgi:AAA15 family ATPase/GTPase
MILNFKLNNYRSYKGEVEFSMLADTARSKSENFFEIPEFEGSKKKIKVLKTALIYGANASGKSNIIKGLHDLIRYILDKPKVIDNVPIYTPFQFASETVNANTKFELTFIGPNSCKYVYSLEVNKKVVLKEKLEYFPNGKGLMILNRENPNNIIADGANEKVDDSQMIETIVLGGKKYTIFKNQLFLSTFVEEPHEVMTSVFLYFKNNFGQHHSELSTISDVNKQLLSDKNLKQRLAQLVRTADTKINDFFIVDLREALEKFKDENPQVPIENTDSFMEFTMHNFYESGNLKHSNSPLLLSEESKGSQTLFALGTKVLKAMEEGKTLIYDELDTSLHPYVTKMLVMLFLSSKINKNNAQLIFTTHDISLLDEDLLRKDQIWFAEKDEQGVSDFYSLQDFNNVREDIPFDKWYMAGKFGGLPNIGEIEKIFE